MQIVVCGKWFTDLVVGIALRLNHRFRIDNTDSTSNLPKIYCDITKILLKEVINTIQTKPKGAFQENVR